MKLGRRIFFSGLPAKSFNATVPDNDFFVTGKEDCLFVVDHCRLLKTCSTILFGWLIKRGRQITLFLLFLPAEALSALLSEGVGVEALMKLPSLLLSLLSAFCVWIFVIGIDDDAIVGVAFGRSIWLASSWDTAIIIILERRIMVIVIGIIINVVFGIIIVAVVVVVCESPTLNPAFKIIIVDVIDKAKGPIILRRIVNVVVGIFINVVFGIVIAVAIAIAVVVVVVIVNCVGPTLLGLTLSLVVRIIIAGVIDEA